MEKLSVYISGIDSLLAIEWCRLEELASLLEPFSKHTNILQTDSQSLSSVIPSILDLECHRQQHTAATELLRKILRDLRQRFSSLLEPDSINFNPLPAAACLLDPTLATVLLTPDCAMLLHAAKLYIYSKCDSQSPETESVSHSQSTPNTPLQRLAHLASKMTTQRVAAAVGSNSAMDSAAGQLNQYISEITEEPSTSALQFWCTRRVRYSKLYALAEDLLSSPASQAYVERIFSLCGMLTAGRRNHMNNSLEMRAFLKLNANFL